MISKTFLEKQKSRLEKEKNKINNQIDVLKNEDPFIDPDHASDNAAIDTDVREQVGHENVQAQIKNLMIRLKEIDYALEKINKKTYGYCDHCQTKIDPKRLDLLPEARYCIDCEKKLRVS